MTEQRESLSKKEELERLYGTPEGLTEVINGSLANITRGLAEEQTADNLRSSIMAGGLIVGGVHFLQVALSSAAAKRIDLDDTLVQEAKLAIDEHVGRTGPFIDKLFAPSSG